MVRANSTCRADKLPSGFSVNCWPRMRMLLSGVRNSCDILARNSDLYFDVRASSLPSLRGRGALARFLILALHFNVPLGELSGFLPELLISLLQFRLLSLQFPGKLLRLLEQCLRLHRGLDTVQHDADAIR